MRVTRLETELRSQVVICLSSVHHSLAFRCFHPGSCQICRFARASITDPTNATSTPRMSHSSRRRSPACAKTSPTPAIAPSPSAKILDPLFSFLARLPCQCRPSASASKMSDEGSSAATAAAAETRARDEDQAPAEKTDTSRSVTANPEAADPEGPTAVPVHDKAAAPSNHHATSTPASPTGGPVPGLPFVAPSSYLRPLNTLARGHSHHRRESGGAIEGEGEGAMRMRKISNPVDREQREGLVS